MPPNEIVEMKRLFLLEYERMCNLYGMRIAEDGSDTDNLVLRVVPLDKHFQSLEDHLNELNASVGRTK